MQDRIYHSNKQTRMAWEDDYWNVYYKLENGADKLWCRCSDVRAVMPGMHTWEFFEGDEGDEPHIRDFETKLNESH
jgi:hypothetical protein